MEGSIISAQISRRKRTSFLVQIRLISLVWILIHKALLAKLRLVDYTMWFGQIMVGSHTHRKRTTPEFVYDDWTTSSKGFSVCSFWSAPMKRTKRNNKPQSWFSLTEQCSFKNAPVWSAKSGVVRCSPSPIQTCGHKKICDCQKVWKLKFDFLWKNGSLFLFWAVEEWRQISCELCSALHSVIRRKDSYHWCHRYPTWRSCPFRIRCPRSFLPHLLTWLIWFSGSRCCALTAILLLAPILASSCFNARSALVSPHCRALSSAKYFIHEAITLHCSSYVIQPVCYLYKLPVCTCSLFSFPYCLALDTRHQKGKVMSEKHIDLCCVVFELWTACSSACSRVFK